MSEAIVAPLAVLVLSVMVLVAPTLARGAGLRGVGALVGTAALHAVVIFAPTAVVAYLAVAVLAAVRIPQLASAWPAARLSLITVAIAAVVVVVGLELERPMVALIGSFTALMLLTGVIPLHGGVASLSAHAPLRLTEQLASAVVVVFTHLRFIAPLPIAYDVAPALVRVGALLTLLPALMALVQPDLRGYFRSAVVMHAGMLLAAVAAAGRGHAAAALLVSVTMTLALGGLGVMVHSVEERAGRIRLVGRGGRIAAFPRLAAAFLLFAAAGVGMPGTAGFMADDLLLHALWEESVAGALTIVVASALLAVASLMTFAKVFLGPPTPSLAPDLRTGERYVAVGLMLVLILIGIVPALLVDPVSAYLQAYGAVPH